jgi:hypothetical protein
VAKDNSLSPSVREWVAEKAKVLDERLRDKASEEIRD